MMESPLAGFGESGSKLENKDFEWLNARITELERRVESALNAREPGRLSAAVRDTLEQMRCDQSLRDADIETRTRVDYRRLKDDVVVAQKCADLLKERVDDLEQAFAVKRVCRIDDGAGIADEVSILSHIVSVAAGTETDGLSQQPATTATPEAKEAEVLLSQSASVIEALEARVGLPVRKGGLKNNIGKLREQIADLRSEIAVNSDDKGISATGAASHLMAGACLARSSSTPAVRAEGAAQFSHSVNLISLEPLRANLLSPAQTPQFPHTVNLISPARRTPQAVQVNEVFSPLQSASLAPPTQAVVSSLSPVYEISGALPTAFQDVLLQSVTRLATSSPRVAVREANSFAAPMLSGRGWIT